MNPGAWLTLNLGVGAVLRLFSPVLLAFGGGNGRRLADADSPGA
jgi:hypothetical protein